jgi:hypothetical protein
MKLYLGFGGDKRNYWYLSLGEDMGERVRRYLGHCPGAQGDNILLQKSSILLGVSKLETSTRMTKAVQSPVVYLGELPGALSTKTLTGVGGGIQLPVSILPALLISFVYLPGFMKNRSAYRFRDWALDSGAFSAANSGIAVDLQEYIDTCLRLKQEDKQLVEIFGFDVIGDPEASIRNVEEMRRQGVDAIPTFHAGSSWHYLEALVKAFGKVGIGGMVPLRGAKKMSFCEQVFGRVWPARLHGFGVAGRKLVLSFPWHSVDATNWEIGPCKYGHWQSFNGSALCIRGSNQDLRSEIRYFLKMEQEARDKWGPVFKQAGLT